MLISIVHAIPGQTQSNRRIESKFESQSSTFELTNLDATAGVQNIDEFGILERPSCAGNGAHWIQG